MDFIQNHWVSIVGAVIGLLYLYLEYKANIWLWAVGVAMAAFYMCIFYFTQLYASMAIYVYFLLASTYGWVKWVLKKRQDNTETTALEHTPKRYIFAIVTSVVVVGVIIYFILTGSGNDLGLITIGDALTTSLNIVALWMISRRWAQQWLLLIPANALSGCLLLAQGDVVSGVVFLIYFVVSIFGYFNWKRIADS